MRLTRALVYSLLVFSIVLVPFSVPNLDNSVSQPVNSSTVTFPALPTRLDFGSWQQTLQGILNWVVAQTRTTYHWFNNFGYLQPVYAVTVTADVNTAGAGTGSTDAPTLNHAANVLIIAAIAGDMRANGSCTTGTVKLNGTTSFSMLTNTHSASSFSSIYAFYLFVAVAANDTINITMNATCGHQWVIASYTNTKQTTPWFEDTGTNSAEGASPQTSSVTVAAGTTGRMVIMVAGGNSPHASASTNTGTWTDGGGGVNVNKNVVACTTSIDGQGVDFNAQQTSASATPTAAWAQSSRCTTLAISGIGTAILPASSAQSLSSTVTLSASGSFSGSRSASLTWRFQ